MCRLRFVSLREFARRVEGKLRRSLPLVPLMSGKWAFQNLADIVEALDNRRVRYWLTDGTLLGFVREGDFISHDHDTDLGIDASTFDSEILADLVHGGFTIERYLGSPSDGFEITVSRRGIRTDLFFFYSTSTWIQHSAYFRFDDQRLDAERLDYRYQPFTVGSRVFRGREWAVPEPSEVYLEEKYGSQWHKAVKAWDYALSPHNVVVTGRRATYSIARPSLHEVMSLFESQLR